MALEEFKGKAEEAVANISKIVEEQRKIVEKQNLTAEQQDKMLADFDKFTEKHDTAIAEYKAEIAKAEQMAKEAEDRAISLEKQFSMLRDNGRSADVSEKDDKALMAAMLRGAEYVEAFTRDEKGAAIYDSYIKGVASINVEGVDVPKMVQFHKQAENLIARKAAETPSLRTDVSLQGGVLLTPMQANEILRKAVAMTPIEQYAKNVTISGKSIQQPVHEQLPRAYFAGELEASTNSVPKYSMMEFAPVRQSVKIPVSMEMLNQTEYDIVGEVNSNAAKAFAVGLGYNAINGTGVKSPEGILNNDSVSKIYTDATNAITAEDIIGVGYHLKSAYNPTYFLNRLVLKRIRLLKDAATGRFIWSPGGDMNQGNMPLINGLPYVDTFTDLPTNTTITSGTAILVLAEMSEFYQITKNSNIFVIRDEISNASEAQVNFIFHRWITGNVRNPEAGVILEQKS